MSCLKEKRRLPEQRFAPLFRPPLPSQEQEEVLEGPAEQGHAEGQQGQARRPRRQGGVASSPRDPFSERAAGDMGQGHHQWHRAGERGSAETAAAAVAAVIGVEGLLGEEVQRLQSLSDQDTTLPLLGAEGMAAELRARLQHEQQQQAQQQAQQQQRQHGVAAEECALPLSLPSAPSCVSKDAVQQGLIHAAADTATGQSRAADERAGAGLGALGPGKASGAAETAPAPAVAPWQHQSQPDLVLPTPDQICSDLDQWGVDGRWIEPWDEAKAKETLQRLWEVWQPSKRRPRKRLRRALEVEGRKLARAHSQEESEEGASTSAGDEEEEAEWDGSSGGEKGEEGAGAAAAGGGDIECAEQDEGAVTGAGLQGSCSELGRGLEAEGREPPAKVLRRTSSDDGGMHGGAGLGTSLSAGPCEGDVGSSKGIVDLGRQPAWERAPGAAGAGTGARAGVGPTAGAGAGQKGAPKQPSDKVINKVCSHVACSAQPYCFIPELERVIFNYGFGHADFFKQQVRFWQVVVFVS